MKLIPSTLDVDGKYTSDINNISHVLLAVYPTNETRITTNLGSFTQLGLEEQFIMHRGTVVYTKVMQIDQVYAYYVALSECDSSARYITKQVGSILCGNYRSLLSPIDGHNFYDYLYTIDSEDKVVIERKETIKKFKYKYNIKNKDMSKISQNHHNHVRLKDIFANKEVVELEGFNAYYALQLDRFNKFMVTHATFWTYLYALPVREKKLFMNLVLTYGCIDNDWLKYEGTVSKQMQSMTEYDLTKIFELQVLENRIDKKLDWGVEKQHRVKPNTVRLDYNSVLKHCTTLFQLAKQEGKKPVKMEWEKYWGQRAVMMPSGAVHSENRNFKELIKKLPHNVRSKKGLASMLGDIEQEEFLNEPCEINAYTSVKYEWGKVRALYGCDFTSHVNSDFGLMGCEDTFPGFIPTGSYANAEYVENQLKTLKHSVPFCFDYDDFNSQHTFDGMTAVIDAWLNVYNEDLDRGQIDAVKWTSASVKNQTVHNHENGDVYRTNGTLFSGWRLTTFVNTALNYAYLAEAGINKYSVKSLHNGDDVIAGIRNLSEVPRILRGCDRISVRANNTKMAMGTIAEFLRMDMRAVEPTASQYLTRACSTFVHSRIESEAPLSGRALLTAYKTRYDEVCERGGKTRKVTRLYKKQLYFASRLFEISKEVVNKYLETDQIAGGNVKNGQIGDYEIADVAIGYEDVNYGQIKELLMPGINSLTTCLCNYYPELKDYISKKQVTSNVLKGYNIQKNTLCINKSSRQELITKRALRGAWSDDANFRVFQRVRFGISDVITVLGKLAPQQASVLAESSDPLKWFSILVSN